MAVALTCAVAVGTAAFAPVAGAVAPARLVAQDTAPDGPSPVGQPLPPTSQRAADTLIAVFLIVVFAGTLVAVATTSRWNRGRRAEAPEPPN